MTTPIELVNVGTNPNDDTGETNRSAFITINEALAELDDRTARPVSLVRYAAETATIHSITETETGVPLPAPGAEQIVGLELVDTWYGPQTGIRFPTLTSLVRATIMANMDESGASVRCLIAAKMATMANKDGATWETLAVHSFLSSSSNEGTIFFSPSRGRVAADSVVVMTTRRDPGGSIVQFVPDDVFGEHIPALSVEVAGLTL